MSLRQPVKYPVKYYSHLDVGAPQLADADGIIKTILKACLVTGYDVKESAGWTALFEDDFRIVLRRPLRTGNPPDIKIENGVINGAASHRIVSQDNPSGLDDPVELASVNLLARDSAHGIEWHLIVSDFGFMLCYQMGENGYTVDRNNVLYCGSMQKMQDNGPDFFTVNKSTKVALSGKATPWLEGMLDNNASQKQQYFVEMKTAIEHYDKSYLILPVSELHFNNDCVGQKIIIGNKSLAPFSCSIAKAYVGLETKTVSIDGRAMLRYVNKMSVSAKTSTVIYIPLDYWEL